EGAISKLGVDDRDNFLHIVSALDMAGRWQHPPVPADPWLRWLTMLAGAHDETNARIIAAQKLADAPDLAGDARTIVILTRLLADEEQNVRYNALVSAADLAGKTSAETRQNLINLIAPLVHDSEPE